MKPETRELLIAMLESQLKIENQKFLELDRMWEADGSNVMPYYRTVGAAINEIKRQLEELKGE